MSEFPQFSSLKLRQKLNKISWGLSFSLNKYLKSKGYLPTTSSETLQLIEVGDRYVKVEYEGDVIRYNFESKGE